MAVTHPRKEAKVRVLAAILSLSKERGYPPTYREIGAEVGIAHSAVHGHVRALSEAGLVNEDAHVARSLRITPAGRAALRHADPVRRVQTAILTSS